MEDKPEKLNKDGNRRKPHSPHPKKLMRVPLLKGEFKPSKTQELFRECYYKELQATRMPINPYIILKEKVGLNPQNWNSWQKRAGFTDWFLDFKEKYHETIGISDVHEAIYQQAFKENGSADRKLYLERFDKGYKPKSDNTFVFVGSRPQENINEKQIVEQSRKYVESVVSTQ